MQKFSDIDPDAFYDVDEMAKLAHVTTRTLANWRSERTGPRPTKLGSRIWYAGSDVLAWIESEKKRAARAWVAS